MLQNPKHTTLTTPDGLVLSYRGPGLSSGPLPSLIYFALSGATTLHVDPFDTPAKCLKDDPIHIFSCDLPFHSDHTEPKDAIAHWTTEITHNRDFITPFVNQWIETLDFLIGENIVDPLRIGAAGLSRGAFAAAHLAARDPRIKAVLGFAPLTSYLSLLDVKSSLAEQLSLRYHVKQLIGKDLRFYIGNRDVRVNTDSCFDFIKTLTEESYESGVRSPPVELIIYPSIGHRGHGTPQEIFIDGARWIRLKIASY